MFVDLHMHTHFSDGTYSPEELTGHARRVGLSAISLTDHDTVEGCPRMIAACTEQGIEFINGCELTAEIDGHEVHILGYGMDILNPKLLKELGRFQLVRQNRIQEMTDRLNEAGIPLKAETVVKIANCRAPGRPHVARALVQEGYCRTHDEAFDRFLKKGKPAWVPKCKMSALEAIDLIHQAGGVAVMAHPGLNRTDDFIPSIIAAGLDGIECFHSKHSTSVTEHYLMLAEQNKLLVTGGSDCHGMSKGRPLIGTIKVPYEYLNRLKRAIALRTSSMAAAASN